MFLYFNWSNQFMNEYQIVERVKDGYREGHRGSYYVLLKGNRISFVTPFSFYESNTQGQISDRAIGSVYLLGMIDGPITLFEFPMFNNGMKIVESYVDKKRYPLPNLKYFIYVVGHENRLTVELVDLDVAANNLNLPKIVSSVLGPKLLSKNNMNEDELYEIAARMRRQILFADHTWDDAYDILYQYFDGNKRELSKEVFKISEAYQRVFRPYRVVYDTKTWQPVLV